MSIFCELVGEHYHSDDLKGQTKIHKTPIFVMFVYFSNGSHFGQRSEVIHHIQIIVCMWWNNALHT